MRLGQWRIISFYIKINWLNHMDREQMGQRANDFLQASAVAMGVVGLGVAAENAVASQEKREIEPKSVVHKISESGDALAQPMKNGADLFVPTESPSDRKPTVLNSTVVVETKTAPVPEVVVDASPVSRDSQVKTVPKPDVAPPQKLSVVESSGDSSADLLKNFSLEKSLRRDPYLGQFLQSWQKKNYRSYSGERRTFSTDTNKAYADFYRDRQLKIWMGIFNNPPETADVQMKKYFHRLIESKTCRDKVHEAVIASSTEFGVPMDIIYGMIGAESGGDTEKISSAKAVGVMQVKHDTAYAEMVRITDIPKYQEMFGKSERWKKMNVGNTKDNIAIGTAYLRYLYEQYHDWNFALMAYNSGPGHFEKDMVRMYNKSVTDKFSVDRERGGKLNVEKPKTVVYDVVRKDFGRFLREQCPSFAAVLNRSNGGEQLNTNYVFKVLVLSPTTKLAVEEGRVK